MPRNRNSELAKLGAPPEAMTWKKATPILVIAGLFDLLRLACENLWFFGPALATVYCAAKASGALSSWTFGLLGTKTGATACGTALGLAGAAAIEVTAPLGIMLAEGVGLFGWLTVLVLLLLKNRRIFSADPSNMVKFGLSLVGDEIPLVGSLPFTTLVLWRLYHAQINKEQAALAAYNARVTELQMRERQEQAAEYIQLQTAHMQEAEEEAANDEAYEEEREAARDGQHGEIPEEIRRAA